MDYDSLLELVKNRRSIRRFRPDPIPDEFVDKIIEVARWAPSGFNTQPWEFVVVKEKDLKDRIVRLTREFSHNGAVMEATVEPQRGKPWETLTSAEMDYSNAPVFILLYGDPRTKMGLPIITRFDKLRVYTTFISSLSNAFLCMHLAATSLGLASQWVSAVAAPYQRCLINDILRIPHQMEIFDMMVVGYPAVEPRSKLLRTREEMIHYDKCDRGEFRTDEEVNDFIKRTRTWVIASHRRKAD